MSKSISAPHSMDGLYAMPGHLIRRVQQISSALFAEECGNFDLTSVQYAALVAIRANPQVDATRLSALIAFDRSTLGDVLERLEARLGTAQLQPERQAGEAPPSLSGRRAGVAARGAGRAPGAGALAGAARPKRSGADRAAPRTACGSAQRYPASAAARRRVAPRLGSNRLRGRRWRPKQADSVHESSVVRRRMQECGRKSRSP